MKNCYSCKNRRNCVLKDFSFRDYPSCRPSYADSCEDYEPKDKFPTLKEALFATLVILGLSLLLSVIN